MKFLKNLLLVVAALSVISASTFFLLDHYLYLNKPLVSNLDNCVTIETKSSAGSGVIFKNGKHAFVWTCHHVVSDLITPQVEFRCDTRTLVAKIELGFCVVKTKLFNEDLDECGVVSMKAKIIRFSEKNDLALLEISDYRIWPKSVEFPQNRKYVPKVGTQIFHIGSMKGFSGHGGMSAGIQGLQGIDLDKDGVAYDKVSASFNFGSSGGGIFEAHSGKCIGIIARVHAANAMAEGYMNPVRRMWALAEKLDCEWAMDASIEVPENYLDQLSVDTYTVPQEALNAWKQKDAGVVPVP